MMTAMISLTDPRLTRYELHLLRTILMRLNGCLPSSSQSYVTKAEKLFSTNRDIDEPEGEGRLQSLADEP